MFWERKAYLLLFVIGFLVLPSASAKVQLSEDDALMPDIDTRDDCLICVDEVVNARDECAMNETSTYECMVDVMGAASDCLKCICDVLDIINDHSGICVDENPGDCIHCVDEIQYAVDHCNAMNTSDLECVEDILAATSDCLRCVCDVIDIIAGGDGICPLKKRRRNREEEKGVPLGNPVVDCYKCQDEVIEAVQICRDNDTSTLDCVEYVMLAGSDCIICICEVVGGLAGVEVDGCDPKPPKTTTPMHLPDCKECIEEISTAYDECTELGLLTVECIEDLLGAGSDCIVCICDVIADMGGIPADGCDPEADEDFIIFRQLLRKAKKMFENGRH